MILAIIVFILLITIDIFIKQQIMEEFDEFNVVAAFVLSLVVFCCSCGMYSALQPVKIVETETKIYTLETAVISEGSFCLGSGSIDGVSYYYYYTQDENGLYELKKVKTDDCKLRLTDNETPKIITKNEVPEENVNWFFCTGNPWDVYCDDKYELVVPTNTIQINSFNGMIK